MEKGHRFPRLYHSGKRQTLIIAHRGASACYPQNTMLAFQKAVELGADMIELDVLLSKDGTPVILHNNKLQKHTNGKGYVDHYTLNELKKLDAGAWFDKSFSGLQIPTLDEVLKFAKGKIALNIEIKSRSVSDRVEGGVEERCLELVEKHGMKGHVLFSSFDSRAITHLRQFDSAIPLAILYDKQHQKPSELIEQYDADVFNCSYRQASRKLIRDINDYGIPLMVYTINKKEQMQKLINKRVSGIFTDQPDLLKRVMEKRED